MTTYLPEGFIQHDGLDTYEMFLPDVNNPLDVDSPTSEDQAAERVCSHLFSAAADPGTWELQWHAACVSAYPWTISRDGFDRLRQEFPPSGVFAHELAAEVFHADVCFALAARHNQEKTR